MKKLISVTVLLVLCFTLFSQAVFADGLSTEKLSPYAINGAKTIYAENREEIVKNLEKLDVVQYSYNKHGFKVDPNTVMPVYKGDIYDYGRSGILNINFDLRNAEQEYIANAVDGAGRVVGVVTFRLEGEFAGITSIRKGSRHDVDYLSNIDRIEPVAKSLGINTNSLFVKFVYVGDYFYYVTDGEKEVLVYANVVSDDTSQHWLLDPAGEVNSQKGLYYGDCIVITDAYKKYLKKEVARMEEANARVEQLKSEGKYEPTTGGDDTVAYATLGATIAVLFVAYQIKRRKAA